MSTTLSDGTTTLALDDLLWTDEFNWSPVAQETARSITGRLIVESTALSSGRPITLAGGDEHGWLPRSTVEALFAWSARPGARFALTLRGATRQVVFAGGAAAATAIDAKPVVDYADPIPGDAYVTTVKFLEVS